MSEFAAQFIATPGQALEVTDIPTRRDDLYAGKSEARKVIKDNSKAIADLQFESYRGLGSQIIRRGRS